MKKTVKRTLAMLIIATMLAATGISAGAINYMTQADALNEMGLFLGTGKGYELGRAPSRAEAAVMVVRLLGREAEVKAGTYTHPFTDVPIWVDKYVGYLYENGIAKGTSPTTYAAGSTCTSQMYTVFVLRTLGYTEDHNSFTYSGALPFAENLGLIESSVSQAGTFSRDDMVAISYSALFQAPEDNAAATLLDKLVLVGAVASDKAEKYIGAYSAYCDYLETTMAAAINAPAEIQQQVEMQISMMGTLATISTVSNMAFEKNGDDIIMKSEDVVNAMGEVLESTTYYYDGYLYTSSEDGKYKTAWDMEDINTLLGLRAEKEPLYLINTINKSTANNEITYTIEYSADMLESYINSMLGTDDYTDTFGDAGMQINAATLVTVIGSDGKIKSQNMDVDVNVNAVVEDEAFELVMIYNMLTTVIALDESVTVTLPSDLDTYVELMA